MALVCSSRTPSRMLKESELTCKTQSDDVVGAVPCSVSCSPTDVTAPLRSAAEEEIDTSQAVVEDENAASSTQQPIALRTTIEEGPTCASVSQRSTGLMPSSEGGTDVIRTQESMTLNVAYEALELVRKVNLQVEFGENVDVSQCLPCLRESLRSSTGATAAKRPGRLRKMLARNKPAAPCLTCGSPVCARHRSPDFRRENIAICCECSHLFSMEYLLKNIVVADEDLDEGTATAACRKKRQDDVLEVYDRALLMLKYSSQYIDDISAALEHNTRRNNKIGLGSSATGVVSGIAGVAAAATIFTPVGPPLLIASILFGGSATAAAAGSEAVNYRCEPNRMADRIVALHAFVSSIARLTTTTAQTTPNAIAKDGELDVSGWGLDDEQVAAEVPAPPGPDMAGDRIEKSAASATNNSLHWTRATMNGLKPLTAGALSAISIVTEAREMKTTVEKIRAGNPCEKAVTLRGIKTEMDDLPETSTLAEHLSMITKGDL